MFSVVTLFCIYHDCVFIITCILSKTGLLIMFPSIPTGSSSHGFIGSLGRWYECSLQPLLMRIWSTSLGLVRLLTKGKLNGNFSFYCTQYGAARRKYKKNCFNCYIYMIVIVVFLLNFVHIFLVGYSTNIKIDIIAIC